MFQVRNNSLEKNNYLDDTENHGVDFTKCFEENKNVSYKIQHSGSPEKYGQDYTLLLLLQ